MGLRTAISTGTPYYRLTMSGSCRISWVSCNLAEHKSDTDRACSCIGPMGEAISLSKQIIPHSTQCPNEMSGYLAVCTVRRVWSHAVNATLIAALRAMYIPGDLVPRFFVLFSETGRVRVAHRRLAQSHTFWIPASQ